MVNPFMLRFVTSLPFENSVAVGNQNAEEILPLLPVVDVAVNMETFIKVLTPV